MPKELAYRPLRNALHGEEARKAMSKVMQAEMPQIGPFNCSLESFSDAVPGIPAIHVRENIRGVRALIKIVQNLGKYSDKGDVPRESAFRFTDMNELFLKVNVCLLKTQCFGKPASSVKQSLNNGPQPIGAIILEVEPFLFAFKVVERLFCRVFFEL